MYPVSATVSSKFGAIERLVESSLPIVDDGEVIISQGVGEQGNDQAIIKSGRSGRRKGLAYMNRSGREGNVNHDRVDSRRAL